MQRDDEARVDGYAAIRSYAAIGDGRTLALIARDGSIDWLCAPELDGASVFGALLDAGRGGRATLRPAEPFSVERRYLDDSNVLETTFVTAGGRVRVTDAMAIAPGDGGSLRTTLRRVECLAGQVEMAWSVAPRFGYGAHDPAVSPAAHGASMGGDDVSLRAYAWDLGEPEVDGLGIRGSRVMDLGDRSLLVLVAGDDPPEGPGRDEFESQIEAAQRWWQDWVRALGYDGPWKDAVVRSGLALKLLVSREGGAVLAAGTTSLPEVIGGVRNWDYRYSWVRDSLLVLDAFFALGSEREATDYFAWLRERLDPGSGKVSVLYDLRGRECAPERELELEGWRGSGPVRTGNAAADQFQQSTYGTLLHACHLYAERAHGGLPDAQRRTILESAVLLARTWREPDAGIWEERTAHCHHTHSKMMSALGLHCAADLARHSSVDHGLAERLAAAAAEAAAFVETQCIHEETGAYLRAAHGTHYDAAVLMPLALGYGRWSAGGRVDRTIDVIREQLGDGGSLLYRYRHDDGLPGEEGFFTPCSFWLAGALSQNGRVDDAASVLDELVGLANDVGLYSEELATDGAFLGNLPQALTHASLVSAAAAVHAATGFGSSSRTGIPRP
jgi:GH15 family glucan-1,4-alpha-glucosidase